MPMEEHEAVTLGRKGNEVAILRDTREVLISCQERETVLATGCCYEKIDSSGIDTFRTARRTESCGGYIGWTSQLKQRIGIEERQQMVELPCRAESIEKFL